MTRKPFEELTIADDFMFCKVMEDESLCKKLNSSVFFKNETLERRRVLRVEP